MGQRRLEAGALLRWTRAGLLCALVLIVSTLAHTSAGGLLPPTWVFVGLAVATALVLAAVLGCPASRLRVVVMLAGGQAVLHLAMTALSGHASPPARGHVPDRADAHTASHVHTASHAPAEASSDLVDTWLTHVLDDLSGANLAMAGAHLLAAAVLGWWVASGEQALWSLVLLLATSPGLLLLAGRLAVALRAIAAGMDGERLARCLPQSPEHVQAEDRLLLACAVLRRGPPTMPCA